MTKQQMMESMNISALSDEWAAIYEEAVKGWEGQIRIICKKDHLLEIMETYGLFKESRQEILMAAEEILQNKEIALLTCLIDRALLSGNPALYTPGETELPFGKDLAHRFYLLIPIIRRIPAIIERYREICISDEVIFATLQEYETCLEIFRLHNGYTGFDKRYYKWTLRVMNSTLFRIGRFNFEVKTFQHSVCGFRHQDGRIMVLADGMRLHKSGQVLGSAGCDEEEGAFDAVITETEDAYVGFPADEMGRIKKEPIRLSKAEWSPVLRRGDDVISVHIPRAGALTKEACEASYETAWKLLRKCFPEHDFKAIICCSWMMDRQLQKLLKPTSNIVSFQNRYMPYPCKSAGGAVFIFVFQFPVGTDLEKIDYQALPEDSSLRKAVKELYLSGGAIYENGGIFLMN
ncbi:MAG: hypothetical protein E7329_04160 [Clostridiales bacterium]|nr:hypothetical protein [Clostridiales bacterium]